jgi:hypothetical protein
MANAGTVFSEFVHYLIHVLKTRPAIAVPRPVCAKVDYFFHPSKQLAVDVPSGIQNQQPFATSRRSAVAEVGGCTKKR